MKRLNLIIITLMFALLTSMAFADRVAHPSSIYGPGKPMTKLMAKSFNVSKIEVITLGQNCHYPADVIVTLYISKNANVGAQKILNQRKQGKSWMEVMDWAGFHPSRLFTAVHHRNITRPYRRPYREYGKWRRNRKYRMVLYDKEVRDLAGLKYMKRRFRMPAWKVMKARSSGISFVSLIRPYIR